MNLFLGIDGGGSHTRALVVNAQGCILGRGQSGSSNYHNVGLETATRQLVEAGQQAAMSADCSLSDIQAAFLGCAGIKSTVDKSRLRGAAETAGLVPEGQIVVENDLVNALTGGLNGRPGIAIIAGTGSNSLGRDVHGHIRICGGWVCMLDDAGSAMGLTLSAMRRAVRGVDGRKPPTRLTASLLAFLGLNEPEELLARLLVNEWSVDSLAAFAPVLMRAANAGDAGAGAVLREGANALGELAATLCRELDFPVGPEIVLLGGCARSGPPYQPLVEAAIARAVPAGRLIEPEASPLEGAALNALRLGGIGPLPILHT
ncbi:MAG: ATPase [Kiritimatiellae bacterium]|nr:ATPase [Kiritimatiellia bacterium]